MKNKYSKKQLEELYNCEIFKDTGFDSCTKFWVAQEYVVSMISAIDREVDLIESQIAQEEELKRWYLKKLLI